MTAHLSRRRRGPLPVRLLGAALIVASLLFAATSANATSGAPVNLTLPVIYASSTTFHVGQVVSASPGTWSGSTPIYYDFSWNRCADQTFASCRPIPGAHQQVYTLTRDDISQQLMVLVKAKNGESAYADSPITPTGVSLALHQAVGPSISGDPVVGATLTASPGIWTGRGALSFTYQWTRCAPNCAPIPDAKQSTYTLTQADVGAKVFVLVKAIGSDTSVFSDSARVGPIDAAPATTTTAPASAAAVQAASVALPERLLISQVQFTPASITSHAQFTARFRVTLEGSGKPVQGALVYALGIPYSWAAGAPEVTTDANGWATVTITPTASLPLERGRVLVLFVRARTPGGSVLGGASTRRLAQVVVR